jgi:spore germination cell wall hydrolase CwlJ-like protein
MTTASAANAPDITKASTDPTQLRPISQQEAIAFNASLPVSGEPNPAALPFTMTKADPQDRERALGCLSAAVYYESATEPSAGKRAVAQAVLNRVRHFAYPKTVCGVVFQGSGRASGCQFTFTCDGSMMRVIDKNLWEAAHMIAIAALNGFVEKSIGYATHYHANYVAPYWQPALLKVAVIDRHIFYRGRDGWGRPSSFTGHYAGKEPEITSMVAVAAALQPRLPDIVTVTNTEEQLRSIVIAEPTLAPAAIESAEASEAPSDRPVTVALPKDAAPPLVKRVVVPHAPVRRRLPM